MNTPPRKTPDPPFWFVILILSPLAVAFFAAKARFYRQAMTPPAVLSQ